MSDESADAQETIHAHLLQRIQQLTQALQPFAAAVAYVVPTMPDAQEILIAFARSKNISSPLETIDTLPTVATVGDVRRAARLLGMSEPQQEAAAQAAKEESTTAR